jgi:hypothetical protein
METVELSRTFCLYLEEVRSKLESVDLRFQFITQLCPRVRLDIEPDRT